MTGHEQSGIGPDARSGAADAPLDRAWRDASDEQPPAALDTAIIAAAGEAVSRDGRERPVSAVARVRSPRVFRQWQSFAVAATVAGLAFVLVQRLPREPTVAVPVSSLPQVTSSESVTASPGEADVSAQAWSAGAAPASVEALAPREPARSAMRDASARPVDSAPVANAAAPASRQVDVIESTPAAGAASAPAAGLSGSISAGARTDVEAKTAAPAAAARERSGAELRPDPGAWADRIAALHAAGDLDGAATNLRNFRAAYEQADEYLPAELRDWARTVE